MISSPWFWVGRMHVLLCELRFACGLPVGFAVNYLHL